MTPGQWVVHGYHVLSDIPWFSMLELRIWTWMILVGPSRPRTVPEVLQDWSTAGNTKATHPAALGFSELGQMGQSLDLNPAKPRHFREGSDPELKTKFWENVANLAVVQIKLSDLQPPTAAQRMNGAEIQHQCWILAFQLFFSVIFNI